MATPNSTPSNAFDTQETVNYIRALYGQYMAAQQQYNKFQTSLTNLQIQKKAIGEEFARTDSDRSVAENNLNNAKLAKSKVETIAEFFKSRVAVTQSMVDNAYNMAVQAFEATEFLNKNAQERVETISNLVTTLNTSTG